MNTCKHTKQENGIHCAKKCLRKPGGEQAGTYFQATFFWETILKCLYKKYAFWIIKDTCFITAFSYPCASSPNFFQSEEHSNFPAQMLTLSMELEPTDTKAVIELPFMCLCRGVQVEMHCYQHVLKTSLNSLKVKYLFPMQFEAIWSQRSKVVA